MKKMLGCCSAHMRGCRHGIMDLGGSVTPCGYLTLISFLTEFHVEIKLDISGLSNCKCMKRCT